MNRHVHRQIDYSDITMTFHTVTGVYHTVASIYKDQPKWYLSKSQCCRHPILHYMYVRNIFCTKMLLYFDNGSCSSKFSLMTSNKYQTTGAMLSWKYAWSGLRIKQNFWIKGWVLFKVMLLSTEFFSHWMLYEVTIYILPVIDNTVCMETYWHSFYKKCLFRKPTLLICKSLRETA